MPPTVLASHCECSVAEAAAAAISFEFETLENALGSWAASEAC